MIQVDSREQNNSHIIREFKKHNIDYVEGIPFGFADYYSTENDVVCIERKKDLIEFCGNCGKGHHKFKKELKAANEAGFKVIILIEEDYRYEDLSLWINKKSKTFRRLIDGTIKRLNVMDGKKMFQICEKWKERFNIEIIFCDKKNTYEKIIEILEDTDENKKARVNKRNDGSAK